MVSEQTLHDDHLLDENIIWEEEQEQQTNLEEPRKGMSFESKDLLHNFSCARKKGFGVRVKGTKFYKERCYITYGCNRGGRTARTCLDSTKEQLTTKTNCPASIYGCSYAENRWVLTKIVLEHNHNLDAGKAKFLRCNRYIPLNVKMAFELNQVAGIKTLKTVSACTISAREFEKLTWIEKDARNHLARVRRTELKEEAMLGYFRKMHADNPKFFHAYELNDQNRLRSVFWADARSIAAFKEFGDVITFDTTYLVNRYDMPFAPFVGVNHHGQSILLGCGLVTPEDNESFEWLFNSFIDCMSGPPNAIITDQEIYDVLLPFALLPIMQYILSGAK